ncbi:MULTISPECIES: hypothetical protein [Clostridium]|uniref:Uncharacterized protein n=1 Tax=Clostridium disporicum TaxID=84024 RepID=A0A174DSA6_9CLOT|nr:MULTISPECIES: hypothetical protein [Clostridium]MBX9184759.1 hypothetical protein [Clostridium sp. K04]MDU3521376.1 hypothetical protein [Clostridium saudiense]MDU7455704.1 hypothetical protein [Clostridium saudiense]MEE0726302.1 hypothetical protein [Clostridium saudiense]CUO28107.1 Uncharacterised protein [Clostridium disporicum]
MSDYYFSSCDYSNESQSDFSNSDVSNFSNSNVSDFSNSSTSDFSNSSASDFSNDFSSSNQDNFSCCDVSIEERTQLSIIANSDTICDLLSEIACKKISLNGYSYLNLNDSCSLFNFVVGNNKRQNSKDVRTVECILDKWCINYIESKTIRVTLPNVKSGTFAKIYCAVSENLDVFSSFFGEDNSLYIETSDNCKAIKCIKSILC